MPNIYDSAYDLEKAIRESEEFTSLKGAYDAVMSDESSKQMFENFRDTQMALQEKQMQGQEITEEEVEKARQVVELVQQHEDISKLMEQEQRLNMVINDVSRIITKPLEELYGEADSESESAE
ncbi:YlbF family regulator [Virgibacillus necropolis]|uniref:YlbF family regulator n=1 Tax=Virgibacillus necropolis TaxID=163877 RepID=UPI00384DA27C